MAKKRKPDSTRLDEVDRSMYSSFTTAANSLSQLYTQAMNQQRLAFQAGERNALEKLHNWILRQQENNIRLTSADIAAYLQHELDYRPEEQQQSQNLVQTTHSGFPVSSNNTFGHTTFGQGPTRPGNLDQTRNHVFSNALSSPVRTSLQHYHLSHGRHYTNNGLRTSENSSFNHQTRDHNPGSNDSSMDMHADSPGPDSSY